MNYVCRLGDLSGPNGNALAIIGNLKRQAKQQGMSSDEWNRIQDDLMSGDYDHLLDIVRDNFDWLDDEEG